MANYNHPKRTYCRDLPYELTQYVPHLSSPPNPDKFQDAIVFVPNLSSPTVKMPVRYPIPLNEYQEMPCESFNNSLLCRISDCSFLPESHDYRLLSPPSGGANLSMHSTRDDSPHLMKRPRLEIQSPINMENQEVKKQDIKRERNRVAAAKCRKKKLEKIAQLEDKAKALRQENDNLANTVHRLKEDVFRLRQNINKHYDSGCDIDIPQVG